MSLGTEQSFDELSGLYRPPSGDMLEWLAQHLVARASETPLSEWTIFLPTHRAAKAFRESLLAHADTDAVIMPNLLTLGQMGKLDVLGLGALDAVSLPPTISGPDTIGALAKWVAYFCAERGQDLGALQTLRMAEKLAGLIDEADSHPNVDWAKLPDLAGDSELAQHWQDSVKFLNIVVEFWPQFLEDTGQTTPNQLRMKLVEILAQHWAVSPPPSPVIVAGSMGTNASTRLLMQTVLACPRGAVILPDCPLDTRPEHLLSLAESPHHPHAALANTITAMAQDPKPLERDAKASLRRQFLTQAFCPPQAMPGWHDVADLDIPAATDGIVFIPADTLADEAVQAALIMRESLEHADQTALLVTPDAGIARRAQAILRSMGVDVPVSQGETLLTDPTAQFWILLAQMRVDPAHQQALANFLHHPYFDTYRADILAFDAHVLRVPRTWTDLSDLEDTIGDWLEQGHLLQHIKPSVAQACWAVIALLREAFEGDDQTPSIAALVDIADKLVVPEMLYASDSAQTIGAWLEAAAAKTAYLDTLTHADLATLLESSAAEVRVQGDTPEHPRLKIYGALEARLLSADRVILAGLVDGQWPAAPASDSFLPSQFRAPLGLPLPEARIGLSARDVFNLLHSPKVYVSWSARDGERLNAPSLWVQRLEACAKAISGDKAFRFVDSIADVLPVWVGAYNAASPSTSPISAPMPRPPESARPSHFSVSDVERLINDPYAFYAQRILGLRPMANIAPEHGANIFGSILHDRLELFETEHKGQQSVGDFIEALGADLAEYGYSDAEQLVLTKSREGSVSDFMAWRDRADVAPDDIATELTIKMTLDLDGKDYTFRGKADVVHHTQTGFSIIDYKSGSVPAIGRVKAGLSPQLPLLGMMLEAQSGGKTHTHGLMYLKLGTKFTPSDHSENAQSLVQSIRDGLPVLLDKYASQTQPYLPADMRRGAYPGRDYVHLSRRAEWSGQTGDDPEEEGDG